jgi:hypothetical protein
MPKVRYEEMRPAEFLEAVARMKALRDVPLPQKRYENAPNDYCRESALWQ